MPKRPIFQHHSEGFRHLLFQFLAPYTVFVLLPVMVLAIVSNRAIHITKTNAMERQVGALDQGVAYVDTVLKTFDVISPHIRMNSDLISLQKLGENHRTEDYYVLWKGLSAIRDSDLTSRNIGACIYYHDSRILLSQYHISNDLEREYGTSYQFGEGDFQDFLERYPAKTFFKEFHPYESIRWNNQEFEGILYSMPMTAECQATLFFLLEGTSISDAFSNILHFGGSLYILDERNQLLFSSNPDLPQDFLFPPLSILSFRGEIPSSFFGEENLAAYVVSDYGLKYISTMPLTVAYKDAAYLSRLSAAMNVLALLLAVGYAFYLAFRSSSQISSMEAILKGAEYDSGAFTGGNVFAYLNNSILHVVQDNRLLSKNVQEQLPILRAVYLDKLINDSFTGEQEQSELERRLGFPLEGFFCVLAVGLEPQKDISSIESLDTLEVYTAQKQQLLTQMEEEFKGWGLLYSRSLDQIVVICQFAAEDTERYQALCEACLQRCSAYMEEDWSFSMRCVGSELFRNIRKVCDHFNLCREALRQAPLFETDSAILWDAAQFSDSRNLFYYPSGFESRLCRQLKAGERDAALETVQEVLDKNLFQMHLQPKMRQIFVSQLKASLLRSLDDSLLPDFQERIFQLDPNLSPKTLRDKVLGLVSEIGGIYQNRSGNKKDGLKQEMLSLVEQEFGNPAMSLKYAASRFQLSEAYFSQLFKELTGENFSTYLDQIRMKHAYELLLKKMKVDDVSEKCGYSTTSTFRRAYKRFYGVSPSQTRGEEKGKKDT